MPSRNKVNDDAQDRFPKGLHGVDFDEPLTGGEAVTGREILSSGTPENSWRDWPTLAHLPSFNPFDLLGKTGRVWILAPHPDDEVLACAGLLRTLFLGGCDVRVVAVTDGAASHPRSTRWTPQQLADVRARESVAALRALGAPGVPLLRIGLDDGQVAGQAVRLKECLLAWVKPGDLVVATWYRDGHPDHEAVGVVAKQVANLCGASLLQMPVWMWHWASPGDARVPWHQALRLPLEKDTLAAKLAAVKCYRSQLEVDETTGNAAIISPVTLERSARQYEIFFNDGI